MALTKPADLSEINQTYLSLVDEMFPTNWRFTYVQKAGSQTAFMRDNALSDSFIDLLKILSTQDINMENKVDKIEGKGLSTNDYTTAEKQKLASLSNYDDTELRTLVAALSNYDDTQVRNLIAALDSNKLNKSDVINKAAINSNLTNDTYPATVAAIRELIGDIDYSSFLKTSDTRLSLTAVSPESQATTDSKVPTVGAVREALNAATPPSITIDSAFSSTSENPLQNKVITNRIQSETADSYTTTKIPTIGVVTSLISNAITAALANFDTTDEKLKARKLSDDDSVDRPLLLGNFAKNSTTDNTDTGYYNGQVYFNAASGELTAPSVV